MHGIEGLKKIISDSKKLTDEELVEKVADATNGEIITDENHVENKINEAIKGLGKRDANKVLKAMKEGLIHLGTLDASLERIEEMKQAKGNA